MIGGARNFFSWVKVFILTSINLYSGMIGATSAHRSSVR
ncbi:hypothetical protein GXM_09878 [Nostoc sphaeroides CCNUC1]|uniref:Uncharacterized protein n=1 Tax=Nostoc sphaeroides CCNUC1 TaxID=2653204 RepID=A0A5P8WI50_9NOSO|nr:hypothetical protein GXM_09878 [Nostoc sphaeroides CCNUC1]